MTEEGGKQRYLLLLVTKMENSKTFMFCLSLHQESLAELEVETISPLSILSFTVKQIFR